MEELCVKLEEIAEDDEYEDDGEEGDEDSTGKTGGKNSLYKSLLSGINNVRKNLKEGV
jgi:hypothetical protein